MVTWSSAADAATEHLRELINSGQLAPGAKVVIDKVAAQLGMSSTPVRDAFKRLQTEGLVDIVPRVGVYIREIPADEVRDVYAIKELLEPLMVRLATLRGTPEQRESLLSSSAALLSLSEQGDVDKYVNLVEERRVLLLAMAESEVLREVFRAIDGRVRLLRYRNLAQPGRTNESAIEHDRIGRAISAGDPEEAGALAGYHVESATRWLNRLMDDDDGHRQD